MRPSAASTQRRLSGLDSPSAPFVLATDTIVRTFMRTFSDMARRHGIYVIAANDQAPFRATRPPRRGPRARPPRRAASRYEATSARVYNEVFVWGPENVRRGGPAVLRNVLASNRKVPLTPIEEAIGLSAGPPGGAAARRNLAPLRIPGTGARLGFATSLPAFRYGEPPAGGDPCADVVQTYMRCLDALGANVVIQADANPGAWTGPDGDGIQLWQPLSWMTSTWRAVADPTVHFDYNVTPMLTGNLGDLAFDGQSAITQRGGALGPGCHYIGNAQWVAGEDRPDLVDEAGPKTEFLVIAPWVAPDGPRDSLRAVSAKLDPLSGDPLSNDYIETAIAADLPFPVDHDRPGCVDLPSKIRSDRRRVGSSGGNDGAANRGHMARRGRGPGGGLLRLAAGRHGAVGAVRRDRARRRGGDPRRHGAQPARAPMALAVHRRRGAQLLGRRCPVVDRRQLPIGRRRVLPRGHTRSWRRASCCSSRRCRRPSGSRAPSTPRSSPSPSGCCSGSTSSRAPSTIPRGRPASRSSAACSTRRWTCSCSPRSRRSSSAPRGGRAPSNCSERACWRCWWPTRWWP